MTSRTRIAHEFVEFVPEPLDEGTIYISIPYASATHLCLCGCGFRVVTPLNPLKWKLIFEGDVISIHPSIGNWGSRCRSHYWIRRNAVLWSKTWTQAEIDANREDHRLEMEGYFAGSGVIEPAASEPAVDRWRRLLRRLRRRKQ